MASLPPQPVNQQRSSRSDESEASSASSHLQGPPDTANVSKSQSTSVNTEVAEPRKCWICFADETEDTPFSSEWRSPCPCALTAHEACLLDWIADLQSPNTRKQRDIGADIRCPQCKSVIVVARPPSYVIDAVYALERTARMFVIPGIVVVVGGCVYSGCLVHGLNTVHLLFGQEDAKQILQRELRLHRRNWTGSILDDVSLLARFVAPTTAVTWSWRVGLGLPLIPIILILSRTTLADSILPILPVIFFATQTGPRERLDLTHWPPSPAMTLAVLPYLRGAYNELFERIFGDQLRRWNREVQPRSTDSGQARQDGNNEQVGVGGNEAPDNIEEGELIMAINLEVDLVQEEANGAGQENAQAGAPGPGVPQPAVQEQAQGGPAAPAVNAAPAPAAVQPQPPIQHVNNLVISTGQIAKKVLGALVFPLISAVMGTALKQILPRSWISPGLGRRPTGPLQTRWGRNIIGGCLFVVLKDAFTVYARWKLAQTHRHRRVLNYDKRRKVHTTS
ncbi:MAG: hypothetical protein M1816_001528 [Peltula sp. TS41687]|nr:MAG: hypothetical protein M1816_001528 [Peltula sp. TS41687]